MKIQDREAIRALSVEELNAQLRECQEKLFKLKFAHATSPLKNGIQLKDLRRHQARLLTWIHQKSSSAVSGKATPVKH